MEQYNPKKIEKNWKKKWQQEKRWQVDLNKAKKPYYNLMMFPYPSAEGLHVGNLYAFVGSDVWGRYMRMHGHDVFEPMGFDAFGIHSENFALKKGMHPRELIKKSTDNFRSQLENVGNIYSWDQVVDTTNPQYYKWTQWLFLQLHKAGLAYHKDAPVLWCPSCLTVLANEQVIAGKCERCDAVAEDKYLRQWFLRITDYADHLLENLKKIDWSEKTKISQANWIGKSYGYRIKFKLQRAEGKTLTEEAKMLEVFTTRPDTLYGATYMVLSSEHPLVDKFKKFIDNWQEVEKYVEKTKKKPKSEKVKQDREKTGVQLKGLVAVNPANNEQISVWIADYVLAEYGTGAVMAVPAHDQRDFEFADKYHLPIKPVVAPTNSDEAPEGAYEGEGTLINSDKFDGISSEEAKEKIAEYVEGNKEKHYHLRDWLISRQRYWGPPIPIIYCKECRKTQGKDAKEGINWTTIGGKEYAIIPVPEKDLPVELPYLEDYKPTGTDKSPLATVEEFVNVKCPDCGADATRETDVSDTFLDSSWYFLRYPSRENDKEAFDKKITKKWLPVDMYIGGQEHAVLHLMYARFITMFLHDQKMLEFSEPFDKFRAHGLLIRDGAKISKSRGNTINPDEYFDAWGVDTVRTYMMFLSPLTDGGDWRDEGIRGVHRFLGRVWGLVQNLQDTSNKDTNKSQDTNSKQHQDLEKIRHQTIKKATEDIERLHYNTAIASLMAYLNELEGLTTRSEATEGSDPGELREYIKTLLVLLTPFAPYITEELWQRLDEKGSIHDQPWPKFDENLAKEETITIPVQINGRVRAQLEVKRGTSKQEVEKLALENDKIKESIGDKKIKKVVVVPDKIVNIVV